MISLLSQRPLQKYSEDKASVFGHSLPDLTPVILLCPTVDKLRVPLSVPLSDLQEQGRGVLLNQSSLLIQNEATGARQYPLWCERGQPSQSELGAFWGSCPPPRLPLLLPFLQTIVTWEEEQLVCVQKGEVPNRGWRHWLEGEQRGGGGKRESSGAPFSFELNPFYVRFCRDTTCYRFSFVY